MSKNIWCDLVDLPDDPVLKTVVKRDESTPKYLGRMMKTLHHGSNNQDSFSVVSYNVLCASYARPHSFPYVSSKNLSWEVRKMRLLSEIIDLDADIICLQEVEHFEFFQKHLGKLGYEGIWKRRTGEKNPDGCTVFYRSSFTLIESVEIDYNEMPIYGAKDAKDYIQCNVGIICKFLWKEREICVANSHFFWNPAYPHVKLLQAVHLIECVRKFTPSVRKVPWIIAGDFNSLPNSYVHEFFTTGKVQDFDYTHPLGLSSIFIKEPKFTN